MRYCPIPFAFILIFAIISSFLSDHQYYNILIGLSAVSMGVIIMYQCIMIAQTTSEKRLIPISYICLGIAYMAYSSAEMLWLIFDLQEMQTYPSVADHAYTVYFIFSIAHVFLTYRYFVKRQKAREMFVFIFLLCVMFSAFAFFTVTEETDPLLVGHGAIFFIFASVLLAGAGLVVYKLKDTKLFGVWIIIGIGICLGAVGDLWYYPLDVLGLYDYGHPVDMIWMASDAIIIFALITHRKMI